MNYPTNNSINIPLYNAINNLVNIPINFPVYLEAILVIIWSGEAAELFHINLEITPSVPNIDSDYHYVFIFYV